MQLNELKSLSLNKVNITPAVTNYIEFCLSSEDKNIQHSFHKIMICNWKDSLTQLLDIIIQYFSSPLLPINCTSLGDLITFYTSNLNLILKMIRHDFTFAYCKEMFDIDIIFNDLSSMDCFGTSTTVEEVVTGVVSRRFSEKFEWDLSNLCNDPEFIDKKIYFYDISLLTHYKELIQTMGRDTNTLNLSNNNLSQAPSKLFNYFVKGTLTAVNISNNNIQSLHALVGVSSYIEKLWIEGNPLCDLIDAMSYVKVCKTIFPILSELDGVKLNQHGLIYPSFKNYLVSQDSKTIRIVNNFVRFYFSHYDMPTRTGVKKLYDENCRIRITTNFSEAEEQTMPQYAKYWPTNQKLKKKKWDFFTPNQIVQEISLIPRTDHDLSTFTVDVLHHDDRFLVLVISGIFKEKSSKKYIASEHIFHFRRTFVFKVHKTQPGKQNTNLLYRITNEIFSITLATEEQVQNSFMHPVRNLNGLHLNKPDQKQIDALVKLFAKISLLKIQEAELRLRAHNWDIRAALQECMLHLRTRKITLEHLTDVSDSEP